MRQVSLFFGIICMLLGIGCSTSGAKYYSCQGFAQGTTYSITYSDSLGRDFSLDFDSLLRRFDFSLSNFNDSSLLSRVNRGEVGVVLDDWFEQCVEVASEVYQQSDSLVDPTLRPLISAYGFGAKGKKAYHQMTDSERDSLLSLVGFYRVRVQGDTLYREDPRMTLDFSSIAQGLSVDVVGGWLVSQGVTNYLVEIGGEIYSEGVNPKGKKWKVGVDKPIEGNIMPGADLQTVIELSGRGLATSGNYRKYFEGDSGEKLTHTIDPRSGKPATHNLLSVTILAPSAALADGYATSCMVGGLAWSRALISAHPELSAYLVYSDGSGNMVSEHL